MKEMTWTELIAIEPRLEDLRAEMAAVDGSDAHFCANRIWYQHFKPRLLRLVGRECDRAELRSEQAWDVAYDTIYAELPPCQDCACL